MYITSKILFTFQQLISQTSFGLFLRTNKLKIIYYLIIFFNYLLFPSTARCKFFLQVLQFSVTAHNGDIFVRFVFNNKNNSNAHVCCLAKLLILLAFKNRMEKRHKILRNKQDWHMRVRTRINNKILQVITKDTQNVCVQE